MSLFGRIFVIGIFVASVYGIIANWHEREIESQPNASSRTDPLPYTSYRRFRRKVLGNMMAIGLWMIWLCFVIIGWKATLLLFSILTVILGVPVYIVNRMKPAWAKGSDSVFTHLVDFFPTDYDVSEWATMFPLVLLQGAWLYFLLFARFGGLCAIGVQTCGSR